MSCDRNQFLLEVYKEHTASWRHEDNILYKFGAVLLPVSFVALGIPYLKDIKEPSLTIFEIISTVGGLLLMTFWVSFVYASHAKIKARFQIVNQIENHIERDWGIKGHKDVPDIRDAAFEPPRPLQLKTHFLETQIFYVYLIMAFILTAWRVYYKYHICVNLALASLLPAVIMEVCLVIAILYHCNIKLGEKGLERLRILNRMGWVNNIR